MTISEQTSFLNQVINTFDVHAYPIPPGRSARGIMAHDFTAECESNSRVGEAIYSLTGTLQTQIYNMQPNHSAWILATGILDPMRVKDETTQKAIDESLKHRLMNLGQRVLAPPSDKAATRKQLRHQFFSHIFETAYNNASVEERLAIINEMHPLLLETPSIYSMCQKGWIEFQEKFNQALSSLASNALEMTCTFLTLAFFATLAPILVKLFVAYVAPHIINYVSPTLASIVIFLLKHQISLFVCFALTIDVTDNYPRLSALMDTISCIIFLPLRLFIITLDELAAVIFGPGASFEQIQQSFSALVANKCTRDQIEYFTREKPNAQKLWTEIIKESQELQLTQEKAPLPAIGGNSLIKI